MDTIEVIKNAIDLGNKLFPNIISSKIYDNPNWKFNESLADMKNVAQENFQAITWFYDNQEKLENEINEIEKQLKSE